MKSLSEVESLSARRAWIEMLLRKITITVDEGSLSARRAWIEMYYGDDLTYSDGSLSARRAWIEI